MTFRGAGKDGAEALALIRVEIPDWDSRVDPVKIAAQATDAKNVLPSDGSVNPGNASQFANHTQRQKAEAAGIGKRTQEKLDALARRAPELLRQVQAGQMSANAAAIAAGIVKSPEIFPAAIMERAKERQRAAGDRNLLQGTRVPVVEPVPQLVDQDAEVEEEEGKSRDIVAASLGISGRTVSDAKVILEKGTEEDIKAFREEKKAPEARLNLLSRRTFAAGR